MRLTLLLLAMRPSRMAVKPVRLTGKLHGPGIFLLAGGGLFAV